MTTRKELAQKLAELRTFNLRFGSRVDIFNLPSSDRDLIVQSLQEAEELADKGHNLTAEFEKLREKIRTLMIERDEVASKYRTLAAEHAKLDDKHRTLAAENAKLESRYQPMAAENAKLADSVRVVAAEQAKLDDKFRALIAERDGALDTLVRLINGQEDAIRAASWVQTKHLEKAATLRPVAAGRGWRPIGTAPKDNASVNLIGRNSAGRFVAPVVSRRNMISADAGVDRWLDWAHGFAPTHWCPIPEPPAPAPGEAVDTANAGPDFAPDEQAWLDDDLLFLSKANKG